MTDKELYRLGIIQRVFDRALLQRDAADILNSVFVRCSVLCACTGQMAQPRLHLPAVDVLQTTGSMNKHAVKPWI
jgi:hypothetical protein